MIDHSFDPKTASRFVLLLRICNVLSGSFTKKGRRSWFNRPRSFLQGKTPAECLDSMPEEVYTLAYRSAFGGIGT